MNAITNAKHYAWGDWTLGIMRSFLSGGAAALLTGSGGAIIGIPGKQVWELMGINFVTMGLYRLGEFLQLHGAPDAVQEALAKAEQANVVVQQKAAEVKDAVADAKNATEEPKV